MRSERFTLTTYLFGCFYLQSEKLCNEKTKLCFGLQRRSLGFCPLSLFEDVHELCAEIAVSSEFACCTQTTPWLATKNAGCGKCEQSGMDESQMNALSPNLQPCMARCTPNLSLHAQQTDRCKCRGRITVDHAHFECRFVKSLWVFFVQANRLSVNPFVPQTQRAFLEGTLFQPWFRRKNDLWCDMTHSVVDDQSWVRWLLCNDIIPKAIPLSERLAQCPHLAAHINTKKLIELARTHRL